MRMQLCPAQLKPFDFINRALPLGHIFNIWGAHGMGKSTILRELHALHGGVFLELKNFADSMRTAHPLSIDETFERFVMDALASNSIVFVDDLHLIAEVVSGYRYPRQGMFELIAENFCKYAEQSGKKLIFANGGWLPRAIRKRCYQHGVDDFEVDDYRFLCHVHLGAEFAGRLDYRKIHRFAPELNAQQLRHTCVWLRKEADLQTERFIEYLRTQQMTSNVDLGEVRAVNLNELKGVDDVIQSLEASIVLPLENDALVTELSLTPRRGVLLAGPPGTGKTTVGRALAHRLKGKFFLIDGTCIADSSDFYCRVCNIFNAARQNSPSVIFIDDSDVIFQSSRETGLYRYLLTMLDGLESESNSRICVMMTAMDVSKLPSALVRSGRIELWLEMRLPDDSARRSILEQLLAPVPEVFRGADVALIASATDSFTGADLSRLIEDGKSLYAYDKARNLPLKGVTEYFLKSAATVRANKRLYAAAESRAHEQPPLSSGACTSVVTCTELQ